MKKVEDRDVYKFMYVYTYIYIYIYTCIYLPRAYWKREDSQPMSYHWRFDSSERCINEKQISKLKKQRNRERRQGTSTSWLMSYCWWFRNPANQLSLVVYPIIHKVFYIPGGCLGLLNHQQYDSVGEMKQQMRQFQGVFLFLVGVIALRGGWKVSSWTFQFVASGAGGCQQCCWKPQSVFFW